MADSVEADRRARIRRLSRRAMEILDYDRIWSGPMGEVATQAAVMRGVEILVASGEQDDMLILERVLQLVCCGRLSSTLRAMIGAAHDGTARVRAFIASDRG